MEPQGRSHYLFRTVMTNGKCLPEVCRILHCFLVLSNYHKAWERRAAAPARVNKPLDFYLLRTNRQDDLTPNVNTRSLALQLLSHSSTKRA